ncbi:MAG: DNA-processing protein DprA [Erysipelotrichaceae bacterium]|nr:DNA-processing protein DprA [Erysipelotrichaceae bacterium]
MRELLIRYAIKYKGSYAAVRKAVREHEYISDIPLQKAITILDEDYPAGLLQLKYPPYVLFYCGNKELLNQESIAVVGSREACNYGINVTEMLVRRLSGTYVIVSGMQQRPVSAY